MKKKKRENDKFMMTTEVARFLNRSNSAVIGYANRGELPSVRAGNRHRLFRESDVRKLAAELEGV